MKGIFAQVGNTGRHAAMPTADSTLPVHDHDVLPGETPRQALIRMQLALRVRRVSDDRAVLTGVALGKVREAIRTLEKSLRGAV